MLHTVLEYITTAIDLFSVLILVVGVVVCAKNIFKAAFTKESGKKKYIDVQLAKIDLGGYILLGLEILIVADIIKTINNATLTDVLVLAAIVAIRTAVSFFLNKEIAAMDEELENDFADEIDF